MPGPPPKDPTTRQRRNKVAGAAVLEDNRQKARVPPLPRRRGADGAPLPKGDPMDWLPETRAWWRDVWRSAMAARYTVADKHGLLLLADLWDSYWRGDRDRAAEIRLKSECFGLSPLARNRLQWEVRGDAAPPRPQAEPPAPTPPPPPGEDPRRVLTMVPKVAGGSGA